MYMQAMHFRKYSTASDVWSFGVVMYEIWSLGHKPFEEYNNPKVHCIRVTMCCECCDHGAIASLQALALIDRGIRLASPPGCPRAIYAFMIKCWYVYYA